MRPPALQLPQRFAVAALVAIGCGLGAIADPAVSQAVAQASGETRLSEALDKLKTLDADFTQVLTDREGRVVERSSGHLLLEKPWRFRWNYTDPQVQLIVADGKRLWIYDRELEQVTVRPIDTTLGGTPAMLLSGKTPLAEEFRAAPVEADSGIDWITLEPVRDDTDFRSLRIGLEGDTLHFMQLDDKLGQRTLLEFTNVHVNQAIDPQQFVFHPPPGADVIGEDSPSQSD